MKRVAVILISFVLSASVSAQEETLINGPIENGGFGGPVVKFSQVQNKFAVLAGGYGGWLINHSFMIGGGGYGLVNNIKAPLAAHFYYGTPNDLSIEFGYGGLVLEYIGQPDMLVHYSVSALIGAGGVGYGYYPDFNNSFYDNADHSSAFFVLEPAAGAELNVTRFFRINGGISYRLVAGAQLPWISNSDLSSLSGYLTFKFGKF